MTLLMAFSWRAFVILAAAERSSVVVQRTCQKGISMRINLLTARKFVILMLLIVLACVYLGGRMLTFYQHLAMQSDLSVLTFHNDNLRTGQNGKVALHRKVLIKSEHPSSK